MLLLAIFLNCLAWMLSKLGSSVPTMHWATLTTWFRAFCSVPVQLAYHTILPICQNALSFTSVKNDQMLLSCLFSAFWKIQSLLDLFTRHVKGPSVKGLCLMFRQKDSRELFQLPCHWYTVVMVCLLCIRGVKDQTVVHTLFRLVFHLLSVGFLVIVGNPTQHLPNPNVIMSATVISKF